MNSPLRMVPKHKCLSDLWDEWYGLGEFADTEGGIDGRNKKYGSKWWKHLEGQQYSRTSRVIKAIEAYSVANNVTTDKAIFDLEELFKECSYSVAKMVNAAQDKGLLQKKAARGKKRTIDQVDDE